MTGKERQDFILDQQTKRIIKTLLQNPERKFNKKELAEESDVSRDALYRRWDDIYQIGVLEEKGSNYKLNQEESASKLVRKFISKVDERITEA